MEYLKSTIEFPFTRYHTLVLYPVKELLPSIGFKTRIWLQNTMPNRKETFINPNILSRSAEG